jgi:hypothetical protein
MSVALPYIIGAIAIGIGATLIMELWNLFLKRAFSFHRAFDGRDAASAIVYADSPFVVLRAPPT